MRKWFLAAAVMIMAQHLSGQITQQLSAGKRPGDSVTAGVVSLTGGYGWGEKAAGYFSIEHSEKRVYFNAGCSLDHDRSYSAMKTSGSDNLAFLGGASTFSAWNSAAPLRNTGDFTTGLNFRIDQKTVLSSIVGYSHSSLVTNTTSQGNYVVHSDSLLLLHVNADEHMSRDNLTWSVGLDHQIKEGELISLDLNGMYSALHAPTPIEGSFSNKAGEPVLLAGDPLSYPDQKGMWDANTKVGALSVNYEAQIGKRFRLETGIKSSYSRTFSASRVESLIHDQWISTEGVATSFLMREAIGAAMAGVNVQVNPRWSIGGDARLEYSDTHIGGMDSSAVNLHPKITKVLPGLSVSYKIGDRSGFLLSFRQRLSRPSYNDLTSFVKYYDPVSVFTGNPRLVPTLASEIRAGYNYRDFNFSIFSGHVDHAIVSGQIQPGPFKGLVYLTTENLDYENNLGFQASLFVKANNWWDMYYGFRGNWVKFRERYTPQPAEKTYFGYFANFDEVLKLPRDFLIEISGWYNGLSYYGTLKLEGVGLIDLSIKKKLKKDKGNFELSVADVFRTNISRTPFGTLTNEYFDLRSDVSIYNESSKRTVVKLTYVRPFGRIANKVGRYRDGDHLDEADRVK
jgi:iron complex outermembrane recepter protein